MNNFFHKLECKILSENQEYEIEKFSFLHLDKFIAYRSKASSLQDGNYFLTGQILYSNQAIRDTILKIKIPCTPAILMHKPNTKVFRHIDEPKNRSCSIINPIYPKENFTPTVFYKSLNDTVGYNCNFTDRMPSLINTREFHELETGSDYRINFQLSFSQDFATILGMIKDNTLFK